MLKNESTWLLTIAITMFLKSAVRCDGIPFDVRRNPLNANTREALEEYKEMKAHPENYKRYDSFASLVRDIDNEA